MANKEFATITDAAALALANSFIILQGANSREATFTQVKALLVPGLTDTSTSEKMTLSDSAAVITPQADFTNGITLSGNTDVLSTFDVGSFTCTISDAASGGNDSPTSLTATYVRVGNRCIVDIRGLNISTAGMTAGNDVYFTGLPFTINAGSFGGGAVVVADLTFTGQIDVNPAGSSTTFRISETVSASAIDFIIVSEISSGVTDFYLNFNFKI